MSLTSPFRPDRIDDSASDDAFRSCATLLLGLFAFFLMVGVVVISRRGPWLDEFWSLWQSQHDIPLSEMVRSRWMADFNPPLFSLVHWIFTPLIGDAVGAHRLLNLLGAAWAAMFSIVAVKRFPHRIGFILVFAAILVSRPTTMLYMAEMRSYFPQLCCYFVLVTATVLILDPSAQGGGDLNWQTDKAMALMTVATIAAAINLHYVSSLLSCLLLGGLAGLCLLRRWRGWALTIVASAIVSLVPLASYLFLQLPFLVDSAKEYWLRETMSEAAATLFFTATGAFRTNPLALLLGALSFAVSLGLFLPASQRWVRGTGAAIFDKGFAGHLVLTKSRAQVSILLFAVLLSFGIAMLVATLRQPLVSERYLLNFEVVAVGLMACLASEALASRRILLVLLVAFTLLSVANNGRKVAREERWNSTAQKVAEFSRACTPSTIFGGVIKRPTFSKNELAVHEWAITRLAQRHGLNVNYLDLSLGRLPPSDAACPSLLWVEHVDWSAIRPKPTVEELLRVLRLDTGTIDIPNAELFTSDSGFVMRLPAK